jgi:hypothetical protein
MKRPLARPRKRRAMLLTTGCQEGGVDGKRHAGATVSPTVHPTAIELGMFARLTILLFVFFAVAGLLHVAAPGHSGVAPNGPAEASSNLTIGRIIAERMPAQP